MKYPEKVEIFKKEFRKNERSSLWIKPNGDDLCYYPHIPEEVKSAVRNNFGIGVDEEILFVRDTSFWHSRNQGLVITDYAIKCIPDNDNVKDYILIPWNSIDHVEYESPCLYFFGEERDDNVPINIDFFTKDMSNAVKRVCGTSLAKALTNIAKTQENLEDDIDDDMSEREKLEKEVNFIKHPETVKVFISTLQDLDLHLYGQVYPNVPSVVESLARKKFFLKKDETILYVNLNKEKDAGIVITDCRFLRLLYDEYRPFFWNWSEITIEYGSNGYIYFVKLDGTREFSGISAEEFGPAKEIPSEKSSSINLDNVKDILIDGAQVAGVAILHQSMVGKVALKVIESSMDSYSEKKYNKEKAIWEREEEEKKKIQKEKNEPYFKLFSKMIESQVPINCDIQNEERNVNQEELHNTKIDSQQKSKVVEKFSKSNYVELDLKSNHDLRAEARNALHGNWMKAIFVTFIYMSVNVVFNFTLWYNEQSIILLLSYILLANPIFYGYRVYALDLCREEDGRVGALFDGFRDYKRVVLTLILKDVYILLWSVLLILPGLVKSYSYAMTVFIMKDHPEMAYNEAIEESMAMMDGYKKKLFLLDLSFIGWILLCVLTYGVGLIFLNPYMSAAHATFYESLKEQKLHY